MQSNLSIQQIKTIENESMELYPNDLVMQDAYWINELEKGGWHKSHINPNINLSNFVATPLNHEQVCKLEGNLNSISQALSKLRNH